MLGLCSCNNPGVSLLLVVLSLLSHRCGFFNSCLGPFSTHKDSRYKSFTNHLVEFGADLILCCLVTSLGDCYCWQVFWIIFVSWFGRYEAELMAAGPGQVVYEVTPSELLCSLNEASLGSGYV